MISAFSQLAARGKDTSRVVDERALHAWALVAAPLDRILQAGRYLTRGRDDRSGAYRAFPRPAPSRTHAPKTPAAPNDAPKPPTP